jgi:hypothetical protein
MVNEGLRLLQRGSPPPTTSDRPTRREHAVNWGDRTRVVGRSSQTLAWVSLPASSPIVVYASVANARGSTKDLVCVVSIEWGHGGASVSSEFPIVRRLRVPLVASMVKISGRLASFAGGPPARDDSADVSAFVAQGSDVDTLRNTRWVRQSGPNGTIADSPQHLMRFECFNAGPTATFVHVFDGAPETGGEPSILIPVGAGRRATARRYDSQAFAQSVTWGASSTSLTYTADPSASVRVDAELLL